MKQHNDIYILGIESSCDETAAAVVANGRQILSDVVLSQIDIHRIYGGVVPEIASRNHVEAVDKVVAEALAEAGVTLSDIDAVADPVLSAEVFKLSDAVLQGNYDLASSILGDLLKMQTEPIIILAALGSQLRRIYTARMAIDSGRDKYWLMELWDMKSDYPAKLLLSAAKRTSADWCADAVKMCQVLDRRMKSEKGIDAVGELKLLLVRLGARRR